MLLIHRRGRVLAVFFLSPVSVASSIRCRPLSAVSSLALPLSVAPSAALGPRPSPHVVPACRSSRPAAGVAVLAASRHSLHAAAFVASRATRHCPWFSLHRLSCDHLLRADFLCRCRPRHLRLGALRHRRRRPVCPALCLPTLALLASRCASRVVRTPCCRPSRSPALCCALFSSCSLLVLMACCRCRSSRCCHASCCRCSRASRCLRLVRCRSFACI